MYQNNHKVSCRFSASPDVSAAFQAAHGTIPYGMTNDYMFRAVLQSNNKVLRGLICSLLHLSKEQVSSVEITNPIILGAAIESKEFRLDINVILNDHTLINLEMQLANQLNWRDRSVMYLCRSFDHLNHGQNYTEARPAIHIGFLDYTLFDEHPEFYACYKLINIKNHHKYSDSLTLNVVNLSRIDLATEEDRRYHIHDWALLFKTTTWEDMKMLASKDEYLYEASKTIFQLSTDEQIRKQCRDREEYQQDIQNYERVLSEREQAILAYQKAIAERESTIAGCQKTIAERESTIAGCQKTIAERESTIAGCQKAIAERESTIAGCQKTIAERESTIAGQKKALEEKETQIQQLLLKIEDLRHKNEG